MDPVEDDSRDIRRLLEDLDGRLREVEKRLGMPRRAATPPASLGRPPAPPVVSLTQTFPAIVTPLNAAPIAATAPPVAPPAPVPTPPEPERPLAPLPTPATSSVVAIAAPQRAEPWSIERLVGGRYFLAAGAIVVVIGVGLFLKLGYDMGWFRMSNAWKCIWGAIFGMTMIGAGEIVRRRINVLASTGLSAAGLGALYLSTYAAHGFYALIGPVAAFILLLLVVAVGVAIAVVAQQAGVAVLAMLGGYLAPFLLTIDNPSPSVVPLHSFALLATGLSLAGWRPGVFRVLRSIAWWGTVILAFVWFVRQGIDHPVVALPYFAAVWAAVHAELILSVRGEYESDAPFDESTPALLLRWRNARPIATSVSTSVFSVLFGVVVLRQNPILPDWFVPAGATAAAALLSMVLAGHLRVLKDSPRTDAQRLGAGLAMQAGALLIAAVALAFSGSLEVCAWLALGVAAVGAGAWIAAPSLCIYGVVPLAIGAARLVTYDALVTRRSFLPVSVWTLVVDRWTLLMLVGAAAWAVSALLVLRLRDGAFRAPPARNSFTPRFLRGAPDAFTIVGLVLLLSSLMHPDTSPGAVSVAWTLTGVLVAVARLREHRLLLAAYAIAVLGAGVAAWGRAYLFHGWIATAQGALVHPGALVGVLSIASFAGLAAWYRRDRGRRPDVTAAHWIVCAAAGIALAWSVSSLEVYRFASRIEEGPRAPVGGLAAWWGMFALALLIAGFKLRARPLQFAGVTGFLLALGAWAAAFVVPGWTASAHGSLVHPGFAIAAALVLAMGAPARLWRSELKSGDEETRNVLLLLIVGAVMLTWVATSFEAFRLAANFRSGTRAQHAAVSVWWGFFSIALLAAGFRWRVSPLRYAGLALLGSATIKALIVDLAEVSAGWRVVSVLGLGLLMLGVALVYVKASAKLLPPALSPSGREMPSRSEGE
jgi:uncharacterized membrane protein